MLFSSSRPADAVRAKALETRERAREIAKPDRGLPGILLTVRTKKYWARRWTEPGRLMKKTWKKVILYFTSILSPISKK